MSIEEARRMVDKFRDYYDLAKEAIERAESQDAAGAVEAAARVWATALEILEEGLRQPLPPGLGLDPSQSNTQKWRADMQRWRTGTEQRLSRGVAIRGAPSLLAPPQPLVLWTPLESASRRASAPAAIRGLSAPGPRAGSGSETRRPATPAAARPANADEREYEDRILGEILDRSPAVEWDDVAGLASAKQALQELVVLPMLRPDLFQGLRAPSRGLLFYGPPGTGKTLLARALAHEARATFFNISAASLTSKWHGEGEKLVRALFRVAEAAAPSVVFMDEIDSLLSRRGTEGEQEASRRLKTEFLSAFDGVAAASGDGPRPQVLLLGATNRPWDLDDAIVRRLPKRLYIPLPDAQAREALLRRALRGQRAEDRIPAVVAAATDGYSGSDLAALCREAAMLPLRELGQRIRDVPADALRALRVADFHAAARVIKPSLAPGALAQFEGWTREHGAVAT